MIATIFEYCGKNVEVRIDNTNCLFRTDNEGFATIESIKLSKEGSIKEFPELKEDKEWKIKTINKFKEKIKSLETENKRMKYIISDLKKHGYKPLYIQKKGHRLVKIK